MSTREPKAADELHKLALSDSAPGIPAVDLNLLVLYSIDIESSKTFYERLGLRFTAQQHGAGPRHYAATLSATVFEIYPCGARQMHGGVRVGFHVQSVDQVMDDLRSHETKIIAEPKPSPWGRRAVVEDPDGNRVEIMEPVAVSHVS